MKILVVNAGSSSLKYQLIDMQNESVISKGIAERIGQKKSRLTVKHGDYESNREVDIPNHTTAVKYVIDALTHKETGVISSMDEIFAVGHRVLIAGEAYNSSVVINDEVMRVIESNIDLGPLHMPANIAGINACKQIMPNASAVAVFDTSFHSTMPPHAFLYGIPYEDYLKHKVRRYGFHGTSHQYITSRVQELTGQKNNRLIVCHLGNGASISAVKDGKCVDTSMGLTPLEGLIMGTRSGDIDPAVIEYLGSKTNMTSAQCIDYLNKKSGVLGISGVASDFRDLTREADNGNERCKLALDMFSYRIKKYVGAYAAVLGGLDVLAFTAGVGENTECVRADVCENMQYLGIKLDLEKNKSAPRGKTCLISSDDSKVKVYIIPTNEELVIARETLRLCAK